MVQAIGSTPGADQVAGQLTATSLQAQLARYQQQLSDCVNCDSSKTTEGKAEIQTLSARISDIKERLDKVTGVKASVETGPLASSVATEIGNQQSSVSNVAESPEKGSSTPGAPSTISTVGTFIDARA